MSNTEEENLVLPADETPKNGVWAEEHPELTPEEIAEGNRLGEVIDPDDDEDNGIGGPV